MYTSPKDDLKNVKNALIENIKPFVRNSKKYIFLLCCSILVSTVLTVLAPYTFASIIDKITLNNSIESIGFGFFIYALLIGLSLIFKETVTYISIIVAETLNYISSTNFFKKIIRKDSHFLLCIILPKFRQCKIRELLP